MSLKDLKAKLSQPSEFSDVIAGVLKSIECVLDDQQAEIDELRTMVLAQETPAPVHSEPVKPEPTHNPQRIGEAVVNQLAGTAAVSQARVETGKK